MSLSPTSLEQGLPIGGGTRLLSPTPGFEDEKIHEEDDTGIAATKLIILSQEDSRRRGLVLRIFLATALFLAGATLLSDSNWAVERICHRNDLCWSDSRVPSSVIDARPSSPDDLLDEPNILRDTPQYVLDYAPYVYLHDEEQFWPSDMAEHLLYTTPSLNYTPIEKDKLQAAPNLTNLNQLNAFERGRHVFLTSNDNVEDRPDWLGSAHNIPEDCLSETSRKRIRSKCKHGRSSAPAVVITIDKGNGIVDAFWFFFYSYNLGNIVLAIRWGNHVGDWEHTMVRFQNGKPSVIFFSEHNFGSAYSYGAVEKIGKRPVVYSAIGTHAMYSTPGLQPYILPLGLLHDETARGPLWDPSLNLHSYTYQPPASSNSKGRKGRDTLTPSTLTPNSPIGWFFFNGKWGDKSYPLEDDRQYGLVGEYHYVNGPLGPRFKNLMRRHVCQGRFEDPCIIKHWLEPPSVQMVPGQGEGEDWPEEGELMPPMDGDDRE